MEHVCEEEVDELVDPEDDGGGEGGYVVHLGDIVGKKRDLGILDPMIFSGKIRKNRKN